MSSLAVSLFALIKSVPDYSAPVQMREKLNPFVSADVPRLRWSDSAAENTASTRRVTVRCGTDGSGSSGVPGLLMRG